MASQRITGRAGMLYVALASGGSAEPVAFTKKWSIDLAPQDFDVTAFGDANQVSLAGIPAIGGDYDGFYDTGSDQLFAAAVDGAARPFYLYTSPGNGFKGQGIFAFSVETPQDGPVTMSGSWKAAGAITRI